MFQRLYVWEQTPQWSTLWEDIVEKAELQLSKKDSKPHYLGALIIEGVRPKSPREVKRFLIIDGQQRLTTIQILLCAYRDFARLNEWKTLDRTTSRLIENADVDVMEHPEEERFKLWPTTLNREVFADIISAGSSEPISKKYPLIRLKRRKRPEPRNALVNAYFFFSEQIRNWTEAKSIESGLNKEDCAFRLLQAIQQDFCVVEISLSEGDDSQEIFYSLNSQGRPLSQSDLLRSLIFMRAEKEQEDRNAIFNDYWSRFETQFWSAEIKRGGRSSSRLDLGLRFFLQAKTGGVIDTRRVNEEYRQWISSAPPRYSSVREELKDFSVHCDIFGQFEDAPLSLSATDFRRTIRVFDVSTALPLVMFLEVDAKISLEQRLSCLASLESFLARRIFTREDTKEYNKFFTEIIRFLVGKEGGDVVRVLNERLLSGWGSTRVWPTDEQVVEYAISRPVFSSIRTPALRFILERLELAMRGKKSEEQFIADGLQIEHVLPQRWGSHWTLAEKTVSPQMVAFPFQANSEMPELVELIRGRNEKLQTLGNLTLLNQYLNPAASNGSFDLKKNEYSHSVLRLNRYFDSFDDWNEDAISARGKKLGEMLCKIWPRPESSQDGAKIGKLLDSVTA